ncbi:hypothetical protein ABT063_47725 [Streptomyces sp. NPDC002838]|uniref:hypothetical protein n=1 Tax=Streptomyces sp. NPDC002838 TaxID=3154436 RepID=UPI00331BD769
MPEAAIARLVGSAAGRVALTGTLSGRPDLCPPEETLAALKTLHPDTRPEDPTAAEDPVPPGPAGTPRLRTAAPREQHRTDRHTAPRLEADAHEQPSQDIPATSPGDR